MLDLQGLSHVDHSSKIFAIRPAENPQVTCVTIPTKFLIRTVGMALSRNAATQRHTAFVLLDSHPSLRSAAGWIFEHSAHIILSNPNRDPLLTHISNTMGPTIPSTKEMISGSDALRGVQRPFDFYWRPREPNFPGVDALICKGNEVWVLQYTISNSHRSATEGLVRVHSLMNHKRWVTWYLVILGSSLSYAEEVRKKQQTDCWEELTNVSACELPFTGEWPCEEIEE